jgi:hypothetical protein
MRKQGFTAKDAKDAKEGATKLYHEGLEGHEECFSKGLFFVSFESFVVKLFFVPLAFLAVRL